MFSILLKTCYQGLYYRVSVFLNISKVSKIHMYLYCIAFQNFHCALHCRILDKKITQKNFYVILNTQKFHYALHYKMSVFLEISK